MPMVMCWWVAPEGVKGAERGQSGGAERGQSGGAERGQQVARREGNHKGLPLQNYNIRLSTELGAEGMRHHGGGDTAAK
jgi:hypothetical protein